METETSERKQQVVDLLKAIETGESAPVGVINPNNYKQHNLGIANGKIAEHWDTIETIAPQDQWHNSNGKF